MHSKHNAKKKSTMVASNTARGIQRDESDWLPPNKLTPDDVSTNPSMQTRFVRVESSKNNTHSRAKQVERVVEIRMSDIVILGR